MSMVDLLLLQIALIPILRNYSEVPRGNSPQFVLAFNLNLCSCPRICDTPLFRFMHVS